jgi:hypothetical protein
MKTAIKLDDEDELDKLVCNLGMPFVELKYIECDVSFDFYEDMEYNIDYIQNIELVNNKDNILALDKQDNIEILYWFCNYKNIREILYKLWEKEQYARKHL